MRRNRYIRSRLARLEGPAGEASTPEGVRNAARRRIASGAFPDDVNEQTRLEAVVMLLDLLDGGWNPATDAVPLPADPDAIDFLGVGGCSIATPIADPALHESLLREAEHLGLDLAFL